MVTGKTHKGTRVDMVLLESALPGRTPCPIGVLLLDISADKLYCKISPDVGAEDEVLGFLAEGLNSKANEVGGQSVLEFLEDQLSNVLRITDREELVVQDPLQALEQLFLDRVVNQT